MQSRKRSTLPETPAPGPTSAPLLLVDLKGRRRADVLPELVDAIAAAGATQAPREVLRILLDREILGTTAVGRGVAIPHARSLGVNRPLLAVGRSRPGVAWEAPDDADVHLVFLLLAPDHPRGRKPYLDQLARIARVAALAENQRRLLAAPDLASIRAILAS